MGICSSRESTSAATAKLIHRDGRLEEFPYPVKVSHILEKNPKSFICNSDDMDFDNILCAMEDEDQLQVGELYFALPLSWLNCPLQADQMGALAVKASLALNTGARDGGGNCCGCGITKKVDPFVLTSRTFVEPSSVETVGGDGVRRGLLGDGGHGRISSSARRKSSFSSELTVILEE